MTHIVEGKCIMSLSWSDSLPGSLDPEFYEALTDELRCKELGSVV